MAERSLQASQEGLEKAKRALINKQWTQKALAERLQVTRQPIGKFFGGKPVDRNLFVEICQTLDLGWEEVIAELPDELAAKAVQDAAIDIDALVEEVREKVKSSIQERCGKMRVLDMEHPIGLSDIYTDVNILEKITGRRRLNLSDLLEAFDPEEEDFNRCGLGQTQQRVPGLDAVNRYPKLMVLGKPGAGKTTFLKYLAIQCICAEFQSNRVPLFITLKQAKKIVDTPASQALEQLKILANHITEKRWREVFLLAVSMLSDAGDLLLSMKDKTDELVASDEKIQEFLFWLNQKSLSMKVACKPGAVRAFYLASALASALVSALVSALASDLDSALLSASALDLALALDLDLDLALDLDLDRNLVSARDLARHLASARTSARDFARTSALVSALASALALDSDLARVSARDFARTSALALDSALASDLASDLASALVSARASASALASALALDSARDLARHLDSALASALEAELQHPLQELKAQLPNLNNSEESKEIDLQWWEVNGQNWIKQLNDVMIEQRNIGHDWQFTQRQLKLLSQYYSANLLLVDCLNSDCYVSREVRQRIEDTLLLPIDIVRK
jgi:predicted NACHT family NTPase